MSRAVTTGMPIRRISFSMPGSTSTLWPSQVRTPSGNSPIAAPCSPQALRRRMDFISAANFLRGTTAAICMIREMPGSCISERVARKWICLRAAMMRVIGSSMPTWLDSTSTGPSRGRACQPSAVIRCQGISDARNTGISR
jgi:hypothetical protein